MLAKKNIRRRTFLYITTAIIAVTLTACSIVYVYFSRMLLDRIESDQAYSTAQTAQSLDTILAEFKRTAYFLCCDRSIPSILTGTQAKEKLPITQRDALMKAFYMYTGAPTASFFTYIHAVLLINPQFPIAQSLGQGFSLSSMNRQYLFSAADVLNTEWYRQTVALGSQLYCFVDAENTEYLFFSNLQNNIYITDPRYSENIGVTLYAVPQAQIRKILRDAKVTDGTIALFLYQDTVMASTEEGLFPVGRALEEAYRPLAALRNRQAGAALTLDQVPYTVANATLYGDWRVVLMIPESDFRQNLMGLLPLFALFIVIILVIGLTISGLFARRLTRPILALSDLMLRVEDERHLVAIEPFKDTHDEVSILYSSYNRMSERIRTLTLQAQAEKEQKRTAELRALQAQINPHFIYNTLDSVNCIALLAGQEHISTMVTALIDILKYSIQFSRTLVTLGEELAYLERYIRIQHLRYMDSFAFTNDIPEAYHAVRIPQITLQPLVENALLHASRESAMLEIRLFLEHEGDGLKIHVTDNGSNASAQRLNDILQDAEDSERYGIGIRNVDKRIRLHMGDAYGLRYRSLDTGGLDAVVVIPGRR